MRGLRSYWSAQIFGGSSYGTKRHSKLSCWKHSLDKPNEIKCFLSVYIRLRHRQGIFTWWICGRNPSLSFSAHSCTVIFTLTTSADIKISIFVDGMNCDNVGWERKIVYIFLIEFGKFVHNDVRVERKRVKIPSKYDRSPCLSVNGWPSGFKCGVIFMLSSKLRPFHEIEIFGTGHVIFIHDSSDVSF